MRAYRDEYYLNEDIGFVQVGILREVGLLDPAGS